MERYRAKISGPLLDRIDIHVEAPAVEFKDLSDNTPAESSAAIRERILAARAVQFERFKNSRTKTNGRMSHRQIKQFCVLKPESMEMIKNTMETLHLSARAYDRILKVSRTIADLDGSKEVKSDHLFEAIGYRTLDRTLWS